MKRTTLAVVLMFFAPATRLVAQIQMKYLDGLAAKAKESVEITLDSSTLQMASNFLGTRNAEHPEVKNLLANLKSIVVRNFEFENEGAYRPEDLQPIRNQLRTPGWSKIVSVDEKGSREISEIYAKTEQGKIVGIAILNAEPKELSVVYIEGAIDLAALSNLGGNFGIPRIQIPNQKGKEKE